MYMCISNLIEFDEINNMSVLTQAVTSLFICLVPKLWHIFTHKNEQLHVRRNELQELKYVVNSYCQSRLLRHRCHGNIQGDNSIDISEETDMGNSCNEHSDEEELLDKNLLHVDTDH